MIKRDISHWTISNSNGKIALLLFAQSLEELLAPYSHDSYRVPALNFHYICHEIANVIELIEENVLDKGNIIPLLAEMKESTNKPLDRVRDSCSRKQKRRF